jgi:hypothetical protein
LILFFKEVKGKVGDIVVTIGFTVWNNLLRDVETMEAFILIHLLLWDYIETPTIEEIIDNVLLPVLVLLEASFMLLVCRTETDV